MKKPRTRHVAQIATACLAIWISAGHAQYSDSERKMFQEAFPLCFDLYPDETTTEYKACIEVSARHAHTEFARDELAAGVRQHLAQQEAMRRAKEQEQIRAERAAAARERGQARRRDARNQALVKTPLGVFVDRWWLGGFGNVLLVQVTLQNNSLGRQTDYRIECRTYGNSGTALGKASGVLYETLSPRERKTFEVNLGIVHPQSARATCSAAPG